MEDLPYSVCTLQQLHSHLDPTRGLTWWAQQDQIRTPSHLEAPSYRHRQRAKPRFPCWSGGFHTQSCSSRLIGLSRLGGSWGLWLWQILPCSLIPHTAPPNTGISFSERYGGFGELIWLPCREIRREEKSKFLKTMNSERTIGEKNQQTGCR